MPVDIEAVLALLPELFPGVQKIPLGNIRPNPQNPGPAISEEEIQALVESIQTNGLQNPLKLMPDRANPLVAGIATHSDNPRLNSEGRPWQVENFRFITFSGNGRYEAMVRLGWQTAPGYILNPTPEETVILGRIDNKVRPKGWWADYQDVERLIQANPNLTQRQIEAKLGIDKDKVGRALGLLPLLNAEARALIVCNADNSNKGIWGISERATAQLAALGPGSGLKAGVKPLGEVTALWPYRAATPGTQELIERALRVALDEQMTETKVRGLVGWVQEGHQPEAYGSQPSKDQAPEEGNEETKALKERLFTVTHSQIVTWLEWYIWFEKRAAEPGGKTLSEWAVIAKEDPALLMKVVPLLKLLNESAREAIWKSVHCCYEGLVFMGGHQFYPQMVLQLAKLEGKDLTKTQKLVEQVVLVAIENEMYAEDLEKLVEWAKAGNDPAEFYVKKT